LRRGDRIVCPARTGSQFVLAGLGCLQQRKTKFPIGGGGLLSLWRQGRNSAIGGSTIRDVRAPVGFSNKPPVTSESPTPVVRSPRL
jgi:hypothetical protein